MPEDLASFPDLEAVHEALAARFGATIGEATLRLGELSLKIAKDDLRPCLRCNNVAGPTTAEVIALVIGGIGLFILMLCWGGQ